MSDDISHTSSAAGGDVTDTGAGLVPADIAFLIKERPLLWYESPREYDALQRSFFRQLAPEGALNCIFVKGAVDYAWEIRRMKRLTHTHINYATPNVAARMLAPDEGLWGNPDRDLVRGQARDVVAGAKERGGDGKPSLSERMEGAGATPEMLHYKALEKTAERLDWIRREQERLEDRFHRLRRDYKTRNKTLAAMARGLIERERAQDTTFREVN